MESCNLPDLRVVTYPVNGKNIKVVRDDIMETGTKERGQEFFYNLDNSIRGVISPAAPTGFGQVAIAKMARRANLKCYIVLAEATFRRSPLITKAQSFGCTYIKVSRYNDLLHYYDPIDRIKISIPTGYPGEGHVKFVSSSLLSKVAEDFGHRHPSIRVLGLGLDDPDYTEALTRSIQESNVNNIYPKRLWITVGSGTIARILARIWPETEFMCVQVGKSIDKAVASIPYHQIFVSPYPFLQSVADPDILPPFPSLANYDAKAWEFILAHGEDGDYFWNVAGSI